MPGSRKWINDGNHNLRSNYAFGGGVGSPGNENGPSVKSGKKKKAQNNPFPPPSWGQRTDSGSYFQSGFSDDFGTPTTTPRAWNSSRDKADPFSTADFDTRFESDFSPNDQQTPSQLSHSRDSTAMNTGFTSGPRFDSLPSSDFTQSTMSPKSTAHSRSMSAASPFSHGGLSSANPFTLNEGSSSTSHQRSFSLAHPPYITPKPELTAPLSPEDGIARAIALYNFEAVEVCVLFYVWLVNRHQFMMMSIFLDNSLVIYHSRKATSSLSPRKARAATIGTSGVRCQN
jgi:hypothetical protein